MAKVAAGRKAKKAVSKSKMFVKSAARPVGKSARPAAMAGRKKLEVKGGIKSAAGYVLPARSEVKAADTWNLTPIYADLAAWDSAFAKVSEQLGGYEKFKGRLGEGAGVLREFFEFDEVVSREMDKLGVYASLRASEDQADQTAQRLRGRYSHLATRAGELESWFRPELMALPEATIEKYLKDAGLAPWRLVIERIVRYRPHTLSPGEEKLLAMQGQMSEAAGQVFRQLNDADLKFGSVKDEKGRTVELGHATYSTLLQSPKAEVRATAFAQYYAQYEAHRNTLAAALGGSIHRDVYYARARGFASAREAALFPDNVPVSVYDNLVSAVRKHLPVKHRYYELRRKALGLKKIRFCDTYVPLLSEVKKHHTWEQAVAVVCDSLAPLGGEYVETLRKGLTTDRWSDRYPNKGKSSGAFSSGCFDTAPYIMMNFRPEVLEHVFTLTHEAGHSMHSWYSRRNQPWQTSQYVIFVAEVASTFNEQLLARHLMDNAKSDKERAYLITRQIDAIRATVVRQTMFAEFERDAHAMAEAGEALTVDALRSCYRKLLDAYFGPAFTIDKELELECMRIPHFYRAFYVYKYATGLAAAIALSRKVLDKTPGALDAYLGFLKSGGSKFPLDLLKDAGVDMTTPAPVEAALTQLGELVDELETLM